jgi:hypothetical protein
MNSKGSRSDNPQEWTIQRNRQNLTQETVRRQTKQKKGNNTEHQRYELQV